jgi:hypothetical protein
MVHVLGANYINILGNGEASYVNITLDGRMYPG